MTTEPQTTTEPVRVPFQLPPYPYDRVAALGKLAAALPGGMVDCSIGTPCDPPPPARDRGAGVVGDRAGLPGFGRKPGAHRGGRGMVGTTLRVADRPALFDLGLRGHQRTGGFGTADAAVATTRSATPCSTRRSRTRPTPWGLRWPGAGRCRCRRVSAAGPGRQGARLTGGLDLESIGPSDAARALCAVVELPFQSDRAAWAISPPRRRGVGPTGYPCSPTSATPSSPGRARPARCSRPVSTAWWPFTRSPSVRTWPACGWASSPATRARGVPPQCPSPCRPHGARAGPGCRRGGVGRRRACGGCSGLAIGSV